MNKHITVIGSSNTDFVLSTARFAQASETILGNSYKTYFGGKGANQAVTIARMGNEVHFIANVGADEFGQRALEKYAFEKVNTQFVSSDSESDSGIAVITVSEDGQNSIIVVPGANAKLSIEHIDAANEIIKQTSLVVIQLEIPLETVYHVIELSKQYQIPVVLNPAPVPNVRLKSDIFKNLFLITPNQHEAFQLTDIAVHDEKSAALAADCLLEMGVQNAIITMGEKGAFFRNKDESFLTKAHLVEVVDTTGAGDIFNGAIAVAVAEGKTWKDAIAFANTASSIGIGRKGAQASIPYRKEVDKKWKRDTLAKKIHS